MKNLKSILIHWAEGNTSKYDSFPQEYTSWKKANTAVLPIYIDSVSSDMGGYNKVKFTVTFEDGETYEGRLDVCEKEDNPVLSNGNVFGKHIKETLEFYLTTQKVQVSEKEKENMKTFLSTYSLE